MGQLRVLIVDDHPVFVALLRHALSGLYSIQVAGSGEEALLAAIAQRPDLITMDHHMSGWDGLETMRRLQADPALASIPVIMCTTDTSTVLLAEAITLGAKGFITKERFTKEAILEMMTDILSSHSGSRTAAT